MSLSQKGKIQNGHSGAGGEALGSLQGGKEGENRAGLLYQRLSDWEARWKPLHRQSWSKMRREGSWPLASSGRGDYYSQPCIVGRDPRPDESAVSVVGTSSSAGFCIPVEQPS